MCWPIVQMRTRVVPVVARRVLAGDVAPPVVLGVAELTAQVLIMVTGKGGCFLPRIVYTRIWGPYGRSRSHLACP